MAAVSQWFEAYGHDAVLPNLRVGAYPLDAGDVAELAAEGVQRVLNLVEDAEYSPEAREAVEDAYARAGIEERRLESIDFGGLSPELLDAATRQLCEWLDDDLSVYLHCRAGWQRSATVAAALLARRRGLDLEDAIALVRSRRPDADPLPHQRDDLRRWWEGVSATDRQREAAAARTAVVLGRPRLRPPRPVRPAPHER